MKTTTKKVVMLAGLILGCAHFVQAVQVSSATNAIGAGSPFLIRTNESMRYVIASTAGAAGVINSTVALQYSSNAQNWVTEVTTAPTSGTGFYVTDLLPQKTGDTYYRFVVSGSSGGKVYITFQDNDDFVAVRKSNKQEDVISAYDESERIAGTVQGDRFNVQNSSDALSLSSATVIGWKIAMPPTRLSDGNIGGELVITKGFCLVGSTGTTGGTTAGNITLSSKPHVSTATATNGDRLTLMGRATSVTFTDEATLVGSGVRLGASTRIIGDGDVLSLIFMNGLWREEYFVNNQ
jgi:hypothetical protein